MTVITPNGSPQATRWQHGQRPSGVRIIPAIPHAFASSKKKDVIEVSTSNSTHAQDAAANGLANTQIANAERGVKETPRSPARAFSSFEYQVAETSTILNITEADLEEISDHNRIDATDGVKNLQPSPSIPEPKEMRSRASGRRPSQRANELPTSSLSLHDSQSVSIISDHNTQISPELQSSGLHEYRHGAPQNLVFGGHLESANSSPAHPTAVITQLFARPPSGTHPASTSFLPSGHTYHVSVTHSSFQAPVAHSPLGSGPPRKPNIHGPQVSTLAHPFHPPRPGRYPHESRRSDHALFPCYQIAPVLRGEIYSPVSQEFTPTSASQLNNVYQVIQTDITRDGTPQDRQFRQHNVAYSDEHPRPALEQKLLSHEGPMPLISHLCLHFGNNEFADYVVQVSHTADQFPTTTLPGHGLILARSPKLRSLMSMPNVEIQNGLKVLNVPVSDRFINLDAALMRALMRLYGAPLPNRQDIIRLATPFMQHESGLAEAAQMRVALALAAAGHFLQIDEIINHGLLLAGHILSWFTIGKALAFALEGGLSTAFTHLEVPAKDKESKASNDDTISNSPLSAPTYGFYSEKLLSIIVSFLVHNIPTNFNFSATAPQLNDPPRLPSEAEPSHSRSVSRLSQIRFGEMTLEDQIPDAITEIASSIVVSLPFPLLKIFFESTVLGERLHWHRVAVLMRTVVQEREQRRQRAMVLRGADVRTKDLLFGAVRWVEYVEPTDQHPLGVRVACHLDMPGQV